MESNTLTRDQVEKAWAMVRDGRYSDAAVARGAKVKWALIKRMRGIRARVVKQGGDPMAMGWFDVASMRPLSVPK